MNSETHFNLAAVRVNRTKFGTLTEAACILMTLGAWAFLLVTGIESSRLAVKLIVMALLTLALAYLLMSTYRPRLMAWGFTIVNIRQLDLLIWTVRILAVELCMCMWACTFCSLLHSQWPVKGVVIAMVATRFIAEIIIERSRK